MAKLTGREERPPLRGGSSLGLLSLDPVGEVEAWICAYVPRRFDRPLWESSIRGFVLPLLLAMRPAGKAIAARQAFALTRLAEWCLSEGLDLDVETVLDPDTVERFITTALAWSRSRATYRSDLRRIGRKLTRHAPWEPPPEAIPRRVLAPPYSRKELGAFRRMAEQQASPERRRAAKAFIALGAGAGLDGRWCTRVRAADITPGRSGVLVRVGPPRPRSVPVLASFEADLIELAEGPPERFLVGGTATSRRRASNLLAGLKWPPGSPSLSTRRLRSTWLAHHLTAGTRLPELARSAGLVGVAVLGDLLKFVPPLDDRDAIRQLRGVVSCDAASRKRGPRWTPRVGENLPGPSSRPPSSSSGAPGSSRRYPGSSIPPPDDPERFRLKASSSRRS